MEMTLSVRPAQSAGWVPIHPDSILGRYFAAQTGYTITHPQKEEIAMSAIPMETTTHLRVVENNKKQMGLLLQAREATRKAWAYVASLPKAAWAWAKRTFHLEAASDFVANGVTWIKHKVLAAAALLGTTGMIGAGLLAISTTTGRKVIGTVLKPFGWLARLFGKAWTAVENRLWNEPEEGKEQGLLGRARNWLSMKMSRLRWFLMGNDAVPGEPVPGLIHKVGMFFFKHVYPIVKVDSTPMLATKVVGAVLFGAKMFALTALLPVAPALILAAKAAVVLTTMAGTTTAVDTLAGRHVPGYVSKTAPVDTTDTEAVTTSAADAAATVTDIPVKEAAPTNRASQRAHDRAKGRRPAAAGGK